MSEKLPLFSIPYTILCDCGRPDEECKEKPCFFRATLYPFIEKRVEAMKKKWRETRVANSS